MTTVKLGTANKTAGKKKEIIGSSKCPASEWMEVVLKSWPRFLTMLAGLMDQHSCGPYKMETFRKHCTSRDPAVSQLSSFVAAPLYVAPSVRGALQGTKQQLIYTGWECHTIHWLGMLHYRNKLTVLCLTVFDRRNEAQTGRAAEECTCENKN